MDTDGNDGWHVSALAAIDAEFPPWHAWEGVIAGLLYARRPRSSPPMVIRSVSVSGLRTEIIRCEQERGITR